MKYKRMLCYINSQEKSALEMTIKERFPVIFTESIENFKKQFADFRTEIDALKHEMHLQKMNLAALGRDGGTEEKINADEHAALQQRSIPQ